MQELKKWLLKPYPFPTTTKAKMLISLGFGKFVFLFLLLFQPFGFESFGNQDLYFSFLFGMITASVMALNLLIFPLLFTKYFDPRKWVIYKMIGFVLVIIVMIALANWSFSFYTMVGEDVVYHNLAFFLKVTVLIGIFPLFIYLYISERVKNKQHKMVAGAISEVQKLKTRIVTTEPESKQISLLGENKKEVFIFSLENLLYIGFEKNYASIYYLENDIVKEQLIRTSLNKIETQLEAYKHIVRCHKSYIVNTHQVAEIQGNARSYLLKIKQIDSAQEVILIPVSRSFPKELLFTLVG